jgi:endoglucanase
VRGGTPRRLRRGINFGNALDTGSGAAPPPLSIEERYFDAVCAAGFDTVRLPVRWSAHADDTAPYAIDPALFRDVDRAVELALARDLSVVVNVHHYHELQDRPREHERRFLALWHQIAAHYVDQPAGLHFELLNEPRNAVTAPLWNRLLRPALAVVRESHPDRGVLVGPVRMNDVAALADLDLPPDEHLIATIHYYAPFEFTHQGASWVTGAQRWLGTTWEDGGRAAVRDDLARAADWAGTHGREMFVGEFGAYEKADLASRVRWTRCVRSEAERLDLGWCYWDFATDFGVFDPTRDAWRTPLHDALLGP